jgi:hypothetical protein
VTSTDDAVDSVPQVHAMVTGPEHLRPDVPADIGVTPGGTFGGITAYLELMRACWAQVSVTTLALDQPGTRCSLFSDDLQPLCCEHMTCA